MKRYNSLFSLFSPGNRISVPVYGLAHLSYAEPERRHLDKLRKNRWVSEPLAGLCPVAVAVVAVALPFFPPTLLPPSLPSSCFHLGRIRKPYGNTEIAAGRLLLQL